MDRLLCMSSVSRFLLLITLFALGVTVVFFSLSSYFFSDISIASNYSALTASVRAAGELLSRYQAREIGGEELRAAVNPVLNGDGEFYMLLDDQQQVLAYTESAAPYFAGSTLPALLEAAGRSESPVARRREDGGAALLVAMKAPGGYVLAGRPMRQYSGAVLSFRSRLLLSLGAVMVFVVLLGMVSARRASRPSRIITEMAGRLKEGEQVTLPENLPGRDMREIAAALNYMSRTVARSISDLKYEKETMALVLEGLTEGILAVDEKGKILHENAAAWQLLGSGEAPAYGAVMAALREDRPEDHWAQKYFSGDRVLYFAISRLPQKDKTGQSRGTVALIRDITEQERLERTRHDYVANISHELRTPLASIRGLGEGLRDGLVTEAEDRKRYYNIIVQEVTRLSRLVNDMLELSSLQSNPAAFEMEKVDPNELIYDLHDRNGSLFAEKGLDFIRSLPEEPLPDILSNEDRLSQVLTIFLDNARKYTPEGGSVTLGAEQAGDGIHFFVRHAGIGMDEETQRLAFERFHQAERGRSDKGSGLGLSIAREVLQKMGVEIALQSAPGQGSEFSFVIGKEQALRS